MLKMEVFDQFNGRCLSIDHCSTSEAASVVLNDCHIGDPQAQCQGKNQQWIAGMHPIKLLFHR